MNHSDFQSNRAAYIYTKSCVNDSKILHTLSLVSDCIVLIYHVDTYVATDSREWNSMQDCNLLGCFRACFVAYCENEY